jgi:hypothetical protein
MFLNFVRDARIVDQFIFEMMKILWANHLNEICNAVTSFFSIVPHFSDKRIETASRRILFYGLDSPHMVKTLLIQNLDSLPLDHKTDIYSRFRLC